MNIYDVLMYGHETVLRAIDGMPDENWEVGGVCGIWSVKNIIAHLTSYEHVLIDTIHSLNQSSLTPYLDRFFQLAERFNDVEVEARNEQSPAETLQEYVETYARAAALMDKIPVETTRRLGILPWYGTEYDLEDYVAYTFYGHKREHSAQIAVFRDSHG